MNWLTSFYETHPEYRTLRVARRSRNSIHFELAPNVFEAHFSIRPSFERTKNGLWLPASGLTRAARLARRLVRNPKAFAQLALALPLLTTLTLQPNATAGVDTFIYSSLTTTNYGTNVSLAWGNDGVGVCRTLIKFDFSSIPAAAVISATTLSFYLTTDLSSNARTLSVYRQLRAWTELGATWNNYSAGNSWQTVGGFGASDCEQTSIGSVAISATETLNQFKDISLTPTSKTALDNGNGWMQRVETESADGYYASSSDAATAANRPKLVVVYTIPITRNIASGRGIAEGRGIAVARGVGTGRGVI